MGVLMMAFSDWGPLLICGTAFTTLGLLKVYGLTKGIVGGGGKPAKCRLLGTCPSWSKQLNYAVIAMFLGIGITYLGILLRLYLKS